MSGGWNTQTGALPEMDSRAPEPLPGALRSPSTAKGGRALKAHLHYDDVAVPEQGTGPFATPRQTIVPESESVSTEPDVWWGTVGIDALIFPKPYRRDETTHPDLRKEEGAKR